MRNFSHYGISTCCIAIQPALLRNTGRCCEMDMDFGLSDPELIEGASRVLDPFLKERNALIRTVRLSN
jgi:hypothetical protein